MGDFADDLMMRGLEEELQWEYHDTHYNGLHYKLLLMNYLKGELPWCKKDGNHTLIQDMEDSHLLNSIRWIDNNHSDRTCMIELKNILLIEKQKRYEKRK
jgi:hypothetical protein